MNIYSQKQKQKFGLFILAVFIGIGLVLYSGNLVKKIADQERNHIELWAESFKDFQQLDLDQPVSPTLFKILNENKSIPVMLVDDQDSIISHRNIKPRIASDSLLLYKKLILMKQQHTPIIIELFDGSKNYVYYQDSVLLTNLFYYPFVQILVISFFIAVAYLAFSSSRRAEENQLWAGMSKETAHQLGTPISSLMAWIELLKLKNRDQSFVDEVEKDVKRLETITERFSGIGSAPLLLRSNLYDVLDEAVSYIKLRTSKRVDYILNFDKIQKLLIPVNESLFGWVIENMCKNAIDAMEGKGKIIITVIEKKDRVFIDIFDNGKGIPKSQYKSVFKPGYTTKKRGWGLGLSLVKRIIETYHSGKIFVKSSDISKGTTFRISLKKQIS